MENTSMSGFLEEVIDWINKTNDLLSQSSQSQSQISPLPDNDVDILINRFIGILQLKSCLENLSIVTKAVANLLIFIENVARKEDEIIFLIQQLINSLVKCYEVTHQKESDILFQDINEIILVCTNEKNMKNQLLNGLMGNILSIVTSTTMHIWIRRNFLKLLTGLLIGSDRRERHKLWDEYYEYVNHLADYIFTCGDYDIQTYLVEILYRFSAKTDRTEIATVWFPNNAIVQSSFANIKDFECDCRIFLNNFNNALGENQLVYSLAAQSCHIGNTQVFKPPDLKYSQFWIDFNLGTGNLIIYCVKTPQSKEMWDTIILNSGEVTEVRMDISPSGETNLSLNLLNHVSELFSSSPTSSTFLGKSVAIIFGTQPMIDCLQRILKIMYSDKLELKSRVRCSVAAMPRKIRNNKLVSSNKIIPPSNDMNASKGNVDKFTTSSSMFGDIKTTKTSGDNQVTDTSHDGENQSSHFNRARQILPKTSKSGDLKICNGMSADLNSKFYPCKTSQILIKTNEPRDTNVGTAIAHDMDKVISRPRIHSKIIKASKSGVSKISSDIVYDHSLDMASFNKSTNPLNTSPDARKIYDTDQDHNADVIAASQREKQKFQKSSKSGGIKIASQSVHNSTSMLINKNEVQEDALNAKKRSKVSCPIDQNVRATNKTSFHLYKGSTNLLTSASNSKPNQITLTQNPLREISNLDHETYKNDTFKASISTKSKITPGVYQFNSKQKTNLHEKENQTKTSSQKHFQSKVSVKQMSTNKIEVSEEVTVNSNNKNDSLSNMNTGQHYQKENKISNSNANYSKISVAHASKRILRLQDSHKKSITNVSLVAESFSKLKTKNDVKTGLNSAISHNANDKQNKSDSGVLSQNENIQIVENPEVAEISTQSVFSNIVKTNENVTQIGMVKEIYSLVDLQNNGDLNVHIDLHSNKIQSKSDDCILSQKEKHGVEIVIASEIEHKSTQSVDVNLIETRKNATQIEIEKEPNYSTGIKDDEDLNVNFDSIASHSQSKIVSNCSLSQKDKTDNDVNEIVNTSEIKMSQQSINMVKTDLNENQMEIVKGLHSLPRLQSKENLNFEIQWDPNENRQLRNKDIPKKNKLRTSKLKKRRSTNHNSSVETSKPVPISDHKQIQIETVSNDKASDKVDSNNISLDKKNKEKKLEKKNGIVKCDSVNIKKQNNKRTVNDICQVADITEVLKEAVQIPPNNENCMNNSDVSVPTIKKYDYDNSPETLNTKQNKNSKLTLSRGRNRAIRKLSRVNQTLKDLKSKKCLSFHKSPIMPSPTKGVNNNINVQARNISNECQAVHDQLPKDTCSIGESISESSNFLEYGLNPIQNNEQLKNIAEDSKENEATSIDLQIDNSLIDSPQQEINTIKIAEETAKMTMSGGRKRATRKFSRVQKKLASSGFAIRKTLTYIESDLNLNDLHCKDNITRKAENLYCDQSTNNVDFNKEVTVNPNDSFYEKDNKVIYNEIIKQSFVSPESKITQQNVDCNQINGESKIQSEVTHDNLCESVASPAKSNQASSKSSFTCSNLDKKNTTLNSGSCNSKSKVLKQNTNYECGGKKTFAKGNMVKQKLGNLISITGVTPLTKYTKKSSKDENINPVEVDHIKSLQNGSLDGNSMIKSSEEKNSSRKKKLHSIRPNVLEEINTAEENITTVLKTPTFEDVYGSRQKNEGKESVKHTRRRKVRPFNKRDVMDASKNKSDPKQVVREALPPLIVKRKEKTFLSSTVVGFESNSNAPSVLDASEILPTKKRKFFQNKRNDYDSIHKEERWECFAASDFKLRQRKKINYDESLFDMVDSPAGDSVSTCSKYSKKRQREKVVLESSSKYDNIDDDTPFGKQIKLSDWREKCSQKRMKVKKYGTKTKTTSFSRASDVKLHKIKELKQNDKNKLKKDENTDYSETKVHPDFVSDPDDEDIERNHISPVRVDAQIRPKRSDVKESNLDQISVAFDDTIIRLHNQIQQISDLPKDEKAVYCPKAKKLAELSHMLIFNLLL